MIKIAVCDDEENIRNYLSDLIRRQSVPCEVRKFASAGQYLTGDWDADLLFLDIEMRSFGSGPDGMSLARKIRGRNLEVQPLIVFVTGYESYVYDAFDVGAFHYLLKPLSEEKFSEVFFRAVRQIAGGGAGVPAVRSLTVRCQENPHLPGLLCREQQSQGGAAFERRDPCLLWEAWRAGAGIERRFLPDSQRVSGQSRLRDSLQQDGGRP